jgi:hypothetical protein
MSTLPKLLVHGPTDIWADEGKQPYSPNSEQGVAHNAKVIEVVNADYALALSTGPQLSPTSLRSLQLYLILLVSFMGSLSNGFDGSGEHLFRKAEDIRCRKHSSIGLSYECC